MGKKAWDEISEETIKRCFVKVGLFPEEMGGIDGDDDPFDGKEMKNLEDLCSRLNLPDHISAQKFLDAENELKTCEQPIDSELPTWRSDVRAMIIQEVLQDSSEPQTKQLRDMCEIADDDEDHEFDCEALQTAEQPAEFAEVNGVEELSNAILNVTDIFTDIFKCNKHNHMRDHRLRQPQKQTLIDSFFK